MSEAKKILIGFAVVGSLCICVAAATFFIFKEFGNRTKNLVSSDPTSIAKIQEKISEFDIPPGYAPTAMNMLIYDVVTLSPDTASQRGPIIMLMQHNGILSGNSAQVEQQMRLSAEQQSSQPGTSFQVVDSFDQEIRGQTVTVTVSEGEYENYTMRKWVTIFKGNQGPTLLMITGSVESWDDELVKDFIESMR